MLTDLQCKRAKAGEKEFKLADARGLYLFVTKTGFRSWRWKFRFAGKEKRLVLGSYPEMSLGSAREARENAARLLKSGVDPSLQAKQLASIRLEEAAATFEAVAREWHSQQVSGWVPRHAADVLKSLEQDVFPKIGVLPIKGLRRRWFWRWCVRSRIAPRSKRRGVCASGSLRSIPTPLP
jgi:hypothetical protein